MAPENGLIGALWNDLKTGLSLGGAAAIAIVGSRAWLCHNRYFGLRGRVVLVTGGSRGLGLRSLVTSAPASWQCGAMSASSPKSRTLLLRLKCGGDLLMFLVNNAGTIVVGPVENQSVEAFEHALRTNFWGAVYVTLSVTEGMKRQGGGRIVNIASIGGKVAFPHLLPYTASKFALAGYSQGLRAELAKDNILVTTVCPGLMCTGSPRNADSVGQHEKEYTWFTVSGSLPASSMNVRGRPDILCEGLRLSRE